ncbi:hypothetical protein, partial [Pseudomonas aeruginosa]|uniref:hypothetical protein n=1 Tax=Pseudomonas aeruginosa TaxID=287 RepID=UPI001F2D56E9
WWQSRTHGLSLNYPQLWSLHRKGSDDLRISRNDGKQGKSIAGRLPYRYVIASWQQAMQVAALCHYALLVSGPEGERGLQRGTSAAH